MSVGAMLQSACVDLPVASAKLIGAGSLAVAGAATSRGRRGQVQDAQLQVAMLAARAQARIQEKQAAHALALQELQYRAQLKVWVAQQEAALAAEKAERQQDRQEAHQRRQVALREQVVDHRAKRQVLPPPGWYTDQDDVKLQQWWDGQEWSGVTRFAPAAAPASGGGAESDIAAGFQRYSQQVRGRRMGK